MRLVESPFAVPGIAIVGLEYQREPEETAKIPPEWAKAVPERRASYVAGRHAAALAIDQVEGAPAEIGIGSRRHPVCPTALCGSISHSFPYAFCVAEAQDFTRIGIDVEALQSAEAAAILVPRAVGVDEVAILEGAHAAGVAETLVFSAKDAFYKGVPSHLQPQMRFDSILLETVDGSFLYFDTSKASACFGTKSI